MTLKLTPRIRLTAGVIIVLLFLLLIGQTAAMHRKQALQELQQSSATDLNRYILSLEQTLDRYRHLPKLISTHWELINLLRDSDDEGLRYNANLYLEQVNQTIGAADVYLMDEYGVTVAASNWREARTFIGRNFNFRPYFTEAMKGETAYYSALGTTSNKRGFYFSYPVKLNGRISGVAVVKINLNDIEQDWSDPLLDILVTDEDGVVFISTRQDWKFRALDPLSQADLQRIVESLRYGSHELKSLEIIERFQRPDGSVLITLVDGERIDNQALDGVRARQYLMQSEPLHDSGLKVSALASTKVVQQGVYEAVALVTFIYVALVMLALFLITRERAKQERARFKQQRTEALEENEARIRAIIDNTHAGLITLDSQGRIESFNPTAEKQFGYKPGAIRGAYFSQLIAKPDRALCWQHISSDEQRRDLELTMEASALRLDGSQFPTELTIGQMVIGGTLHFIVTVHDMTERKLYEEKLQRARDLLESRVVERTADLTATNDKLRDEVQQHQQTQNELIQTAKLAVLGQLAAGINHELNQPLTAIRAYADNAQAFLEMGRADTAQTNLKEIGGLTERMAKIIHPLKEFSRNSSGQPEPVCLQSLRDGAMSILYGRLERDGAEIHWPSNLAQEYVLGDMVRLEQVLVNLISNALQAMEALDKKPIDISLKQQDDKLQLIVRDHGPGISTAELGRVFEPFYTTKASGQGLGLGLSISFRIIESLNGCLSVTNHPEGGAQFVIELPRCDAPQSDLIQ